MRCEEVRDLLPGVDEGEPVDIRARRHIESCLPCQAEVARYQKLLRTLAELRSVPVAPPAGLLEEILEAVGRRSLLPTLSSRQKAAVAGALGAVAAGAAATALVLVRRRGFRLATLVVGPAR